MNLRTQKILVSTGYRLFRAEERTIRESTVGGWKLYGRYESKTALKRAWDDLMKGERNLGDHWQPLAFDVIASEEKKWQELGDIEDSPLGGNAVKAAGYKGMAAGLRISLSILQNDDQKKEDSEQ